MFLNYHLPHLSIVVDFLVIMLCFLGVIGLHLKENEQGAWRNVGNLIVRMETVIYLLMFGALAMFVTTLILL